MQPIFMDESGGIGFGCGATAYFVLVCAIPESGKVLNKCIKNINAHLIRNGWNPAVEIKASNIWHAPNNPDIPDTYKYKKAPATPMAYILESLAKVQGCFDYAIVKLDTLKPTWRAIPNCILYNFFAWQLLRNPLCHYPAVELFADRRNREYHNQLKFDGYILGQIAVERANKNLSPLNLKINHLHSNSGAECKTEDRPRVEFGVRGIEAADFFSWAVKRKFENNDEQWYALVKSKAKHIQTLSF